MTKLLLINARVMKRITYLVAGLFLLFSPGIVMGEVEIGAYLGTSPPTKEAITEFEGMVGKHISSVLWYEGWNLIYQPIFNTSFLEENVRHHDGYNTGTILHITLEPWVNLSDITSGVYDSFLQNYASDAKQWGGEVRLRFGHEMIQDDNPFTSGWYPWQDNPEGYKSAFQYIHNIFRQDVGADNVKFVWSPNHHLADPAVLEKYYPGPEYVDWIGIDGYNWGYPTASEPWGWQLSFDQIFYDLYQSFVQNTDIFGDKPIMIGEFASAEGELKAEWILETFQKIKEEYPEIEAFYWLNQDKERDWRVDSSAEALSAFRQAISDAYFTSHASSGEPPGGQVNPQNIKVNVHIPSVNMLKVNITKVGDGNWQASPHMEFGALSYDQQFKIFRASSHYAVDVGIISNQPGWVITHTTTAVSNGIDTLDQNINVVFIKQDQEQTQTEPIGKFSFQDSNGVSFNKAQIDNAANWLRIYYGIAAGNGDVPGVEPITVAKSAGTYAGSVTLTLTY
ncbi:MAG: hypothetical protein NG712_02340 [Omnitrophica bacterium]|nr:hypothetical protein [Candidatus Omnitrophota bacterium]